MTSIPRRIIDYNIKKIKESDGVAHRRGNRRSTKVTQTVSHAIRQFVHRNTAISTRQLAAKIENTQDISISHVSIWQHMKKKGY